MWKKVRVLVCIFGWMTFLFGSTTKAQTTVRNFIKQNAFPISTIQPDSTDYADLEPIGKAIGNASIVMLGEQDHGDAFTFSAKSRLVKYLHEKLGFHVIAFESDFFGLNLGWEKVSKQKEEINPFLKDNLLHLWANCTSCQNLLYSYIPDSYHTMHTLNVAGFDNQMFLRYSLTHLLKSIDSLISALHLPIAEAVNYKKEILPLFDSLISKQWIKVYHKNYPPDSEFVTCNYYLEMLKQQASDKLDKDNFWLMVIDNLICQNNMLANFKDAGKDHPSVLDDIRDSQMASNLKWLVKNKYPGEKIIVWAANTHTGRYHEKGHSSMGYLLANRDFLQQDIYTLAFTSSSGSSGRLGSPAYSIEAPLSNSVENWINPSYQYAFVDYKEYNKAYPAAREKFGQRGSVYKSSKKEWNKIYDGIFLSERCVPVIKPAGTG